MRKLAMMILWVLWTVVFAVGTSLAAPVPDTGVIKCYDDAGNVITCPSAGQRFYGQDANYAINPPSYTKLDSSGNALAVSATSWAMVRDNVTGLMWQKDTARDGQGNYDPMTWEEALAYCESRTIGDHTDWRLPTIKELLSLVDYTQYNPTIDKVHFPNTESSYYWSSTTHAGHTGGARDVNFIYGFGSWNYKSCNDYVRAVRAGQSGSFDYYVEPLGKCGELTPCYSTIQGALNAATDGDTIQAAKTLTPAEPVWGKTGTVTISGGWTPDFRYQDGTTSIYAPRVTGGGGVKVMPNVKVIPPQ